MWKLIAIGLCLFAGGCDVACATDNECGEDEYCSNDDSDFRICEPLKGPGDGCEHDRQCSAGLTCDLDYGSGRSCMQSGVADLGGNGLP